MNDIIDQATKLWQLDHDKEAIELLESLNLEVNAEANTLIGQIYTGAERGISNIKKDVKKGIQFLQMGLNLGDSEAGLELADIYYIGNGVKESNKKAVEYWRLSHTLGNESAGFQLANFYYDNLNEKIDDAIQIYKELIERHEFEENSYYKLSRIYEKGIGGIIPNLELSIEYMEKGAELGHVHCCMNLGLRYYKGEGVTQNIKKSIEIVERVRDHEFFKEEVNAILDKMMKNEKI